MNSQIATKIMRKPRAISRRTSLAIFSPMASSPFSRMRSSPSGKQTFEEKAAKPEPLFDTLKTHIYEKELIERKYRDLIRVAHIIQLEFTKENKPKQVVDPGMIFSDEEFPDKHNRQLLQIFHTIKVLIEFFFHANKKAGRRPIDNSLCKEMCTYLSNCLDSKDMSLEEAMKGLSKVFAPMSISDKLSFLDEDPEMLLRENSNLDSDGSKRDLGEKYCEEDLELAYHVLESVKGVLSFMHLSVIVYAIEEIRRKLDLGIEHLTKDIHDNGWRISVRLDERLVEVSHTRREAVLRQKGQDGKNYWEIEYNLTVIFDSLMEKFQAVRLALTNLEFSDEADPEVKQKIKEKFFNGKFIIC
eukprot:snap_masked-scaffold_46-processed-gene-0.39-mRNA-1 protein AED:0.04 eAED:1.00 QI:0/-1/0/1/-1/1/1/0/356